MIVAIDPDTHKSGVATLQVISSKCSDEIDLQLSSMSFIELQRFLEDVRPKEVRIEAGWLNEVASYHSAKNKKVAARIGSYVGANAQVGKLIAEACQASAIDHKLIRPLKKTWGKDHRSKISHEELMNLLKKKNITCHSTTTNQEERDAALLAIASF